MANATYCSNCENLIICKYASRLTEFEAQATKFNADNAPTPVRISITSVNYNCRHKQTIQA